MAEACVPRSSRDRASVIVNACPGAETVRTMIIPRQRTARRSVRRNGTSALSTKVGNQAACSPFRTSNLARARFFGRVDFGPLFEVQAVASVAARLAGKSPQKIARIQVLNVLLSSAILFSDRVYAWKAFFCL